MSKLLYLAVPYSHPDPAIRAERYETAVRTVDALVRSGSVVLCGRIYAQQLESREQPLVLWPLFRELINRADEFCVLALHGHTESAGIRQELAYAELRGKPVRYVIPV